MRIRSIFRLSARYKTHRSFPPSSDTSVAAPAHLSPPLRWLFFPGARRHFDFPGRGLPGNRRSNHRVPPGTLETFVADPHWAVRRGHNAFSSSPGDPLPSCTQIDPGIHRFRCLRLAFCAELGPQKNPAEEYSRNPNKFSVLSFAASLLEKLHQIIIRFLRSHQRKLFHGPSSSTPCPSLPLPRQ